MAHQTRKEVSVQFGPRSTLSRPPLAALLGNVAAEWSFLERQMTFLYAYLMGLYPPRPPEFEPPIHPVALQVFDTLETLHLRLELLVKLATWLVKDAELLRDLRDQWIPSIRDAARLRNNLIHGHWGVCDEYPDALILNPIFGHNLAHTEADFNEAIDRITETRTTLGRFEIRLRKGKDAETPAKQVHAPDRRKRCLRIPRANGPRRQVMHVVEAVEKVHFYSRLDIMTTTYSIGYETRKCRFRLFDSFVCGSNRQV